MKPCSLGQRDTIKKGLGCENWDEQKKQNHLKLDLRGDLKYSHSHVQLLATALVMLAAEACSSDQKRQ
jgi:hypothetical protein